LVFLISILAPLFGAYPTQEEKPFDQAQKLEELRGPRYVGDDEYPQRAVAQKHQKFEKRESDGQLYNLSPWTNQAGAELPN
jgi:hypothetical protein